MEFKIRKDFILKSIDYNKQELSDPLVSYDYDQLSQAVSYFLNYINKIDDSEKPIGINYHDLSFLTVAFALAIIKSKKDTVLVLDHVLDNTDDLNLFSFFFVAGRQTGVDKSASNFVNQAPDCRFDVDSLDTMKAVEAWPDREPLTFEFGRNAKTYILYFNAKQPVLLTNSGIMDESSIIAAMDNYVYEDDYCVLKRSFNHVGVHTLIIFPSLFKAKSVAVVDGNVDAWNKACEGATHIHMSYQMIQLGLQLPKKLRTLSTGGYHFNKDCLDYVYSQCDIERIVDCYGTSTCPPPLAIRELTKENSFGLQPFKWVNKVFYPRMNINEGQMRIVSDGTYSFAGIGGMASDDLVIADVIEKLDDNTFYLYGSKENYIRVLDTRITTKELTQMLDAVVDNVKIEFTTSDKTSVPKLITNISNKEKLNNFVIENKVEATIEYTDD